MSIYTVSKKGKRDQNEDNDTIFVNLNKSDPNLPQINIYGIYDGHGGKFVSKYLSKELPQYFLKKDLIYPLSSKYIKDTFKLVQDTLEKKYESDADYCGSTCLIIVDYKSEGKRYLDIMNLGDSRCVISKKNIGQTITKDHKPNWPDEKKRIQKMGGEIYYDGYDWRIGDLSVSRSFGDLDSKPYISCIPDVFRYKISHHDQFMIIGCDGLWDVVSAQDASNYVISQCYDLESNRINKKTNIAKMLAELALQKGSTDNVSVIVVFFN
jgi:serine/threonine protein phosphatase PrpC